MNSYETLERLTALAHRHGAHVPVVTETQTPDGDGQNPETGYAEIAAVESIITPNGQRVIVLR